MKPNENPEVEKYNDQIEKRSSLGGLDSKFKMIEDRISKLEDEWIDIIKYEAMSNKKFWIDSQRPY